MSAKSIFLAVLFIALVNKSFAQDITTSSSNTKVASWFVPDYVSLQLAGNIGFLSTGIGYKIFNGVWNAELLYGFIPKSFSKSKDIHLITIKNTFPIFTKKISKKFIISPIGGFGITYDVGTNTFTSLPNQFPEGYYVPNAIHFTLFGGVNLYQNFTNTKTFKGVDYYLELGTVESYLWFAITSKEVTLADAFSFAVGINLHL